MKMFNEDNFEDFADAVRRGMANKKVRSQKDLADQLDMSVSSLSRLLNNKFSSINNQDVAKVVAYLDIKLLDLQDFILEGCEEAFLSLVKIYRNQFGTNLEVKEGQIQDDELSKTIEESKNNREVDEGDKHKGKEETKSQFKAKIANTTVAFGESKKRSTKEKLDDLTPKQKLFLSDFLDLHDDEKDLIVDTANNIISYLKSISVNFI